MGRALTSSLMRNEDLNKGDRARALAMVRHGGMDYYSGWDAKLSKKSEIAVLSKSRQSQLPGKYCRQQMLYSNSRVASR